MVKEREAARTTVYPNMRMRRLRETEPLRSLVRETHLRVEKLIYPFFIVEGVNKRTAIMSMPGIFQQSIDHVLAEIDEAVAEGIKSVLLFGIPQHKDSEAPAPGQKTASSTRRSDKLRRRIPS